MLCSNIYIMLINLMGSAQLICMDEYTELLTIYLCTYYFTSATNYTIAVFYDFRDVTISVKFY